MVHRVLLWSAFFIGFYAFGYAQPQSYTVTSDDWLRTIAGNAVKKPSPASFPAANPGYALYFSQAGQIKVPYLVRVPKNYDPARPASVVVFLHGAILAKDSFQYKDPAIANEPIFSVADTLNTIVVFPFARSDFKWSGQSGAFMNIMSVISKMESDYNVDHTKIYIGGISMGGIATFWFINHKPELFAGFYTFSAAPHGPDDAIKYINITNSKPLFSLNAKDDPVFSYTDMEAAYKEHKGEAPGWHFSTVETGGHRFIYGKDGDKYVQSVIGSLLSSH